MIKVDNITVKFDNKIVFDSYSNTFEDNKIIGILGSSGCGKSTLLRTIAGLITPSKGQIIFNNSKIKKPNPEIFMMHQTYSNFPWKNCLKNVLFPIQIQEKITSKHEEEAKKILEKVGLEDYIYKYPHELSGGMKQRLALARILMSKPKVVLMDEPLSALDPKTRNDMQNLVLQMHYETKNTIIMVTRDPDEAKKMCDIIIKL